MTRTSSKIILFGTSEFAIPALEALIKEGYKITAVITNPDEPVGRKKVLTPPPVKVAAEKLGLEILQPPKLKDNVGFLQILNTKYKIQNTGLGIIAAYGKIVPAEIINLSPFGILNIHPSLLPKYRGPTPIQSVILNGEKETGVTIIKIDEEIDHGPIVATSDPRSTSKLDYGAGKRQATGKKYKELEDELAKLGAELLVKVLPDYLAGKIKPRPQDHLRATFTRKFTRDDAKIDWNKTAGEIDRQIRALNPEPGTWITWNGKILKILEAEVINRESGEVGQVSKEENKIVVRTAKGSIAPKTIQFEGRKAMSAEDFARGNRNFIGAVLE